MKSKFLFIILFIAGFSLFAQEGKMYNSCLSGDCVSGFGKQKIYKDGKQIFHYEGNFSKGKFHGKGTLIFSDGSSFRGEWKYQKMHGKGHMKMADGAEIKGIWKNGKKHGFFWEKTKEGHVLQVNHKDDLATGEGVFTYKNGSWFRANYKEGKREGNMILYSSKSNQFTHHEMKNDEAVKELELPDYFIKSDSVRTAVLYQLRTFLAIIDEKDGVGYMRFLDNDVYRGTFDKNNAPGGKGIMFSLKGGYVKGNFKLGYIHGLGEQLFPNGTRFVGMFDYGTREGKGTFYYYNGDTLSGTWKKGLLEGEVIYYWKSNNKTKKYIYKNGDPID